MICFFDIYFSLLEFFNLDCDEIKKYNFEVCLDNY